MSILHRVLSLVCLMSLFIADAAMAFDSLSFRPQRLVLEGRDRSGVLSLVNRSDTAKTYRIRFADVIYNEQGGSNMVDQTPPGFPSAKTFLRYSPRQVRLEPGEGQTIRVLVRFPGTLPDGEYRAHMVFQALPERGSVASALESQVQSQDTGSNTVSVSVGVTPGVAIPIIVRKGSVTANARLGGTRFVRDASGDGVEVELLRSGNASTYGDIAITSAGAEVGLMRGVVVPVPLQRRVYKVPLRGGVAGGPLTIEYRDNKTGQVLGKGTVFAQ